MNQLIKNVHIPFKSYNSFTVKEVNESGEDATVIGYASTFNNLDYAKDIMLPGAFKKSIKEKKSKWPVKLNHKDDIGINVKAKEDEEGLKVESKLYTGPNPIQRAQETLALLKNAIRYEHKMGLSVAGFANVINVVWDKDKGMMYEIKEFEILEHSITSIPANPKARIDQAKALKSALGIKDDTVCQKKLFAFLEKYVESMSNQLQE